MIVFVVVPNSIFSHGYNLDQRWYGASRLSPEVSFGGTESPQCLGLSLYQGGTPLGQCWEMDWLRFVELVLQLLPESLGGSSDVPAFCPAVLLGAKAGL